MAITNKSLVLSALKSLANLLGEREIPAGLRDQIENLRANMRRTWSDLGDEAASEVKETALVEAFTALSEQAVKADGTARIKIIAPGWGASGYYAPDVLQRDAAVFAPGTKMYWNHPTRSEESERPERDLNDLAAEMVTGAVWANDPEGPGLYADAKVFERYRDAVNELAPHIGVSIRAMGQATPGEAEGKTGAIITAITDARSVDFVTTPGAGGKILSLFEAARSGEEIETDMAESEDLKAQVEKLTAENAELKKQIETMKAEADEKETKAKEAARVAEAARVLETTLAAIEMTETTRRKLTETLTLRAVPEDTWSAASYAARVQEAANAEIAYLAEVAGAKAPVVTGMGGTAAVEPDWEKQLNESMKIIVGKG